MSAEDDIQAVLDDLIPDRDRSEDLLIAHLCAAAQEIRRRRQANTEAGAVVFAALRDTGLSWRQIEDCTGVPVRTARRWAEQAP